MPKNQVCLRGCFGGLVRFALPLIFLSCASHPEHPPYIASAALSQLARNETNILHWGYDAEDSTEFLQAAFDSEYPVLVVPADAGPWITRPLVLPSDKTIIFEPGSLLVAKRGEYPGKNDSLLSGSQLNNLKLTGYGAELRMWKEDYQNPPYEAGEWRSAITLKASQNIIIEGFKISSSGGDGVYLGSNWKSEVPHNKNIMLRNLELANHHRQGISVISVDGLVIEGCTIYGTNGTPPAAGIDFEPNRHYELLKNIVVRNCKIYKNSGQGILIQIQKLTRESEPVDISIEDSYILDNFYNIALVGTQFNPPGTIRLRNLENGLLNLYLPGQGIILERD